MVIISLIIKVNIISIFILLLHILFEFKFQRMFIQGATTRHAAIVIANQRVSSIIVHELIK